MAGYVGYVSRYVEEPNAVLFVRVAKTTTQEQRKARGSSAKGTS
jgi:hypothetical protein